MCGLPGGYPDDLIDVDLDALEDPDGDGVIRVSNADYLARPLRLTPTEASALIVALRALRDGCDDETREVVDRVLGKLETAAAEGAAPLVDVGDRVDELAGLRAQLAGRVEQQAPGAADLLRPVPRRGVRAGRRPARAGLRHRVRLPRRLVPPRRGAPAVPAGPDPLGRGHRRARRRRARSRASRWPTGSSSRTATRAASYSTWSRRRAGFRTTTPSRRYAGAAAAPSRSPCWSPTRAGWTGCCSGSRPTPPSSTRPSWRDSFRDAAAAALRLYGEGRVGWPRPSRTR